MSDHDFRERKVVRAEKKASQILIAVDFLDAHCQKQWASKMSKVWISLPKSNVHHDWFTQPPPEPKYVLGSRIWFYNRQTTINLLKVLLYSWYYFHILGHYLWLMCRALAILWYFEWKLLLTFHNSQSSQSRPTVEKWFQSHLTSRLKLSNARFTLCEFKVALFCVLFSFSLSFGDRIVFLCSPP